MVDELVEEELELVGEAPPEQVPTLPASRQPGLRPEAVSLLRRVVEKVLAEPRSLCMEFWVIWDPVWIGHHGYVVPAGGVVGCIGGWAVIMQGNIPLSQVWMVDDGTIGLKARVVLGLDQDQLERLCLPKAWPLKYRCMAFGLRPQTKALAEVVAARVRKFVETDGRV